MRSYERNGVHVDQCESCRGIFLDMGELEAIIRATQPLPAEPRQPERRPPEPRQPEYQQPYGQPPYAGQPYAPGWGHPHKRRGGIASLFFSS
jgi:Zn-finger nucleic acid-binding protein